MKGKGQGEKPSSFLFIFPLKDESPLFPLSSALSISSSLFPFLFLSSAFSFLLLFLSPSRALSPRRGEKGISKPPPIPSFFPPTGGKGKGRRRKKWAPKGVNVGGAHWGKTGVFIFPFPPVGGKPGERANERERKGMGRG